MKVLQSIAIVMISLLSVASLRAGRGVSTFRRLTRTMVSAGPGGSAALEPVRVRFAPSPTGSLHVGGARTALFNWLLARKTKGKFLIRVEDTDEARSTRASEESILADVKWMNMDWDEGPVVDGPFAPYRQSERKTLYQEKAQELIEAGLAYPCFSTEEELNEKREAAEAAGLSAKYDGTWRDADPAEVQRRLDAGEPYTVRFKVPSAKVVSIDDVVRGTVSWDAEASLGDFIIMRSSGMPVYNFCVAVDDMHMQITHVIRAEEHLTNTLRQLLVLEAMGCPPPTYAHCSLILGSDKQKLSKRHGATSVQQFGEQGFLPDAMMNYLANLGWNDGTPKEIYTPDELVEAFDLSRIVKSSAVFDMDKLRWINGQHLKALPAAELNALILADMQKSGMVSGGDAAAQAAFAEQVGRIALKDMLLVPDAQPLVQRCLEFELSAALTSDAALDAAKVVASGDFERIVATLVADADSGKMPAGSAETFRDDWKAYLKELGKTLELKGKGLFQPVRLALTGRMSGPDVGEQVLLLHCAAGVTDGVVSLTDRIEALRALDLPAVVTSAQAQVEAAASQDGSE